jgi:hypothetical protein
MPRRSTAGRVSKLMGFDPTTAPFTHSAIGRAKGCGEVLIALFGMSMCLQNDASTQSQRLRRGVCSHQVLKVFGLCLAQGDRIAGFGTAHRVAPPALSLSSLLDPVKLGKHL